TLEMDNHSDDGVSANCKITILQSLLLKKGKLKTADTITVLNDAGDAIGYYSRASYVVGNLQRKIKSRTDERYFFPVGQEGRTSYFPASVDVFSMEGTKFITAAFRPLERYIQSHLNTRDSEMNYDYIAPEGMWTISPDREPAGGWFDLRLWISGMSGLQDNLFAILKRPAGAAPREWTASFGEMSPFGGEGRELADGYALKKYCTSFSEYAIGGTGRGIPIELLNFNATLGNGVVSLQWSTASETNNAFFTVEKSNGADFMEVAKISGSGNSSVEKNYTAVDDKPYTGISYYRLKQTDFDGNSKYSEVISVNNISAKTQMAFFPNPSEGVFKLKFFSPVPKVDLVIYSQQGTASFSKSFSSTAEVILSLKKELLPGIYYMQVSTGSEDFTIQKIVIE
ncbi:MAG TPA: T9SS type A sorting domain-containing protein, partial [Chitinophagales bacterium]|nr:T9SS type A sorting domain-containing protein [Chitinophagales bacterium]